MRNCHTVVNGYRVSISTILELMLLKNNEFLSASRAYVKTGTKCDTDPIDRRFSAAR
jgi:hypothetical protein